MALSIRDLLTQTLEDLLENEFRKFKWKLCEIPLWASPRGQGGAASIPRGVLEKADPLTTTELILSYCGSSSALDVAARVLENIQQRELSNRLRERVPETQCSPASLISSLSLQKRTSRASASFSEAAVAPDARQRSRGKKRASWKISQEMYRSEIRHKYERVKDYNSLPGAWRSLEQHYVAPLIIRRCRPASEREPELLSKGPRHLELLRLCGEGGSDRVHLDHLLDGPGGRRPLTVVLQGAAGIGKSYTAHKIMLAWASQRLYHDRFDWVFLFNCRELGVEPRPRSLVDLVLSDCPALGPHVGQIFSSPQRLLFLLDGFDELQLPRSLEDDERGAEEEGEEEEGQEEEAAASAGWRRAGAAVRRRRPAAATVRLLLRQRLLPGCLVVVTTRPSALEQVEGCIRADVHLEVLGFLEPERQAFFTRFFGDAKRGREAYEAVQGNEALSTMCFVPLVCWIVCTVLHKQLEKGQGLDGLQTTTQVFLHFLSILLRFHRRRGARAPADSLLEQLGTLAVHGLMARKVIFDQEDLEAHGLPAAAPPTIFLSAVLRQGVTVETVYSFGHVMLQEVFAAIFCFLPGRGARPELGLAHLLEAGLQAENGHLLQTIRFLFGLSHPQCQAMLRQLLPHRAALTPSPEGALLSWVQRSAESPRAEDPRFLLELLHCLYEWHCDGLVGRVASELNIRFLLFPLKRSDCLALAYCLGCCASVSCLHLYSCGLDQGDIRLLLPALGKCQALHLGLSDIPSGLMQEIGRSFSPKQSVTSLLLQGLGSNHSNSQKETVFKVSALWGSEPCSLRVNNVDKETTLEFCFWAVPAHRPREVTLQGTQLCESSFRQICRLLRFSYSKLESLRISGNLLTKGCIPHLELLVRANTGLTHLDLSGNSLGDEAVVLLCAHLGAAAGQLRNLSLVENGLTQECVPALSSLLPKLPALTCLKLGFNSLGDPGLLILAPALSDPTCGLLKLDLEANGLTDACMPTLAQALAQNQTLEALILNGNKLSNLSIPHLDVIWREATHLCRLELLFNQLPSTTRSRYSMYFNPWGKKPWEPDVVGEATGGEAPEDETAK
ncbi:NACHT, LRR and PYD domains-containing protein 3-like [Ornithorhynchus anatinus]|uniref:NACHT, LRR and PYD domains-containing protein 3-like n=1 Tax=Ornithorhynchus anatinus TaxID=9258 RepID=UPI0019D4C361|nr:NACHT, LRR and PYD domains-containing protein 3-like [Ornithorhynchus anatinus]